MNCLLIVFLGFSTAWGFKEKISPKLQEITQKEDQVDVVVYFDSHAELSASESILDRASRVNFVVDQLIKETQASQRPVQKWLQSNGIDYEPFFSANALLIPKFPTTFLSTLVKFSGVRGVGVDVESHLDSPFPKFPWPEKEENQSSKIGVATHLKTIKVDRVWDELGVTGEGIVVAGQDTGYYWRHNALKEKYRGYNQGQVDHNYNWLDAISESVCSPSGQEPCDDKDHGTHTMGTMVGDDGQGNQIGVAPGAQWIGCRNMKVGVGKVSTYMRCFDFFLAPYPIGGNPQQDGRPDLAPHIVNNSWSCPTSEGCAGNEFYNVVQAYKAAGIMLVAAAGNNGPNCGTISQQPGSYAGDILVVGAWNSFLKEIAFFSSLGPSPFQNQLAPNLIAPGGFVKSSLASGPNAYDDKAGTSMASPQVAGVVALLWSQRPELIGQIDATIDLIEKSADPITASKSCPGFPGGQTPNAVYGHGMLNAYKALTTN